MSAGFADEWLAGAGRRGVVCCILVQLQQLVELTVCIMLSMAAGASKYLP